MEWSRRQKVAFLILTPLAMWALIFAILGTAFRPQAPRPPQLGAENLGAILRAYR